MTLHYLGRSKTDTRPHLSVLSTLGDLASCELTCVFRNWYQSYRILRWEEAKGVINPMAAFVSLSNHNFYKLTNATSLTTKKKTMKVIFASLSAVLLSSIPGVLSAEVSFQRA